MGVVINLADGEEIRTPNETLDVAKDDCYNDLIVAGWDGNGDLCIRSNSGMLRKDVLWLIEQIKKTVLDDE